MKPIPYRGEVKYSTPRPSSDPSPINPYLISPISRIPAPKESTPGHEVQAWCPKSPWVDEKVAEETDE